MVKFLKSKNEKQKSIIEKGDVPKIKGNVDTHPHNFMVTTGMIHWCAHLSPEAFDLLTKGSKLNSKVWYKAVWYVQHDPNISNSNLAHILDVSWPTAQLVKRRVLTILTKPEELVD